MTYLVWTSINQLGHPRNGLITNKMFVLAILSLGIDLKELKGKSSFICNIGKQNDWCVIKGNKIRKMTSC